MKNQSGTIKTNLELDRVVMGGSGGYRRLPGGSDDFSLQTDKQTLHHNIYIIIIATFTFPSFSEFSMMAKVDQIHPDVKKNYNCNQCG